MPNLVSFLANNTSSTGGTLAATINGDCPAGSLIFVVATGVTNAPTSCTDQVSNPYTLLATNVASTSVSTGAFYSPNITHLPSGDTITGTWAASGTSKTIVPFVLYGALTSSPLDINITNEASTASPSLATGTLAQANEIIFAVVCWSSTSSTLTEDTTHNWISCGTYRASATHTVHVAMQYVSATTSVTYNPTLSGATTVAVGLYSFKLKGPMTTTFFVNGAGNFTVPAGVTGLHIEGIGEAGKGFTTSNTKAGGGGGAFAQIFETAVAGDTIGFTIGVGNTATDTTVTKNSSAVLVAKHGVTASTSTGGAGGAAASCTPTTGAYSGGQGGTASTSGTGAGGGGGAGSPFGAGKSGGAGTAASTGSGGGGAAGGALAAVGAGGSGTTGGAGGAGPDATGAGAASGGAATANLGGGGAGGSAAAGGGAGAIFKIWKQTSDSTFAGPGGGGGGGGTGTGGGTATNYGAGSGGASTAGTPGKGLVVITYINVPSTGFAYTYMTIIGLAFKDLIFEKKKEKLYGISTNDTFSIYYKRHFHRSGMYIYSKYKCSNTRN